MLRLRRASQVDDGEANEIILLNSHDGTSSYQLIAGMSAHCECHHLTVVSARTGI
jgi:hypothetical protein